MNTEKPVVLITGASSGFGWETARIMADRNWRVFGTSRDGNSGQIEGGQMLELDVRDDESVSRCVEQVLEQAGRIDVLVNNAGYGLYGFTEETTIQQVRDIFDTNFFGLVRMTKAVLPTMRRQHRGRIINIGSLGGQIAMPYRTIYSTTKFAIEGYSESLSYELAPFDIKVCIVEPGFYRTGLHQKMLKSAESISEYDIIRKQLDKYFGKELRIGGKPSKVGKLIADIAQAKSPRLRYRIGPYSILLPFLKTFLPQRLYAKALLKWYKLTKQI